MYSVPVEVVRLEELGPELLLTQLTRHVLKVLLLDGGVSLEDGLDDVRGEVVPETVGTVGLGFNFREKGTWNIEFQRGKEHRKYNFREERT